MRAEPVKKEPTQLMANNKGKASVDQELIRELAKLLDETGLSEIEIDRDGMRVRVARELRMQARQRWQRRRPRCRRPQPAADQAKAAVDDPGRASRLRALADGRHHLSGARARRRQLRRGRHRASPRVRRS